MRIDFFDAAPTAWDDSVPFPTLSSGFAAAARTTGHRALFATDGASRALVLVRSLPFVRWWTARAKVYVDTTTPAFVDALTAELRARHVSYVKFGDALWGLPVPPRLDDGTTKTTTTHLMMFDATVTDVEALARMEPKTRAHVRKSEREGVSVEAITDRRGLATFCALLDETHDRMRARNVAGALPHRYFEIVLDTMVPRREALYLLARAGGTPLAGALFLLSKERMSYYVGASTRDRALTARHGPSAVFWHAMQLAHRLEIPIFDLGAVTPTDDTAHPHYSVYQFKRGFGGSVRPLHGAEVVLSPMRYRFQDRIVLPTWSRLYPLYLWLTSQWVAQREARAHAHR